MTNPPEEDGTQGRWVLITRSLMAGYGLFQTESDAWDYAIKRGWAEKDFDRSRVDTLPLIDPRSDRWNSNT